METKAKIILVIYHSQNGTIEHMAKRFAKGAKKETTDLTTKGRLFQGCPTNVPENPGIELL
jgi:multimeric flavodoxin WrbA